MSIVISFHAFTGFHYHLFGPVVRFGLELGCISISLWTPMIEDCFDRYSNELHRLQALNQLTRLD